LQKFLQAASGNARILTIAPELLGAMPCIDAARSLGMVVSMGHTDATYEQARAAIAHGAHHATHAYNAMRPFSHRDPGVIGAVLTSAEVNAELIADGIHVDEIAMKVLLQAKGPEHVVLISDGTPATGMPDGKYKLGGIDVTVINGVWPGCRRKARRQHAHTRSGVAKHCWARDPVRSRCAHAYAQSRDSPWHRIQEGALRTGADADILLLNDALQITRVWTRGLSN